jgi:hypothetical protein
MATIPSKWCKCGNGNIETLAARRSGSFGANSLFPPYFFIHPDDVRLSVSHPQKRTFYFLINILLRKLQVSTVVYP